MYMTLGYIECKPQDFKICAQGHINWCENLRCWNCDDEEFSFDIVEIAQWISDEIQIREEIDGVKDYSECEIEV